MSKKGIIYMGVGPNGKVYIGQHNTLHFDNRKKSHIKNYYTFLKKKCIKELELHFGLTTNQNINPTGFCTALYTAFQKYGPSEFKWSVLKTDVPLDKLNEEENKFIAEYNSLSPNGYNLKTNGTKDGNGYSEESKQRMKESSIKKVKDNLHKYRRNNEELKDVPQYVTYFNSGGIRGYRIVRHPKCPFKQFADATTDVNELKRQLLEFLARCESQPHETVQKKKQSAGVPKGISESKPGRFIVQFACKGVKYTKFFSQEPREVALQNAIKWMNDKKEELKNIPKQKDSTTE